MLRLSSKSISKLTQEYVIISKVMEIDHGPAPCHVLMDPRESFNHFARFPAVQGHDIMIKCPDTYSPCNNMIFESFVLTAFTVGMIYIRLFLDVSVSAIMSTSL